MKNKPIAAMLAAMTVLLVLVLGCSYLKKGGSGAGGSSLSGGGLSDAKDYFPLRAGNSWKYRSTTANGQQSEFTIKVLSEEKENGNPMYLVETVSTFQPIHDWYSKSGGWVLMHRQEYVKTGMKTEYQPAKQFLKNPLNSGDSWHWSGKVMMNLDADESNEVSGPETVTVPAGKFEAMKVTTKVVQGGATVSKTYWYAGGVGMVKSMTDTGSVKSTTELLEYGAGR